MEIEKSPIFLVDDYRDFLKRAFAIKKSKNARFSFRQFAALVGFKSPNYLQMILDGRRNLSITLAESISLKLKLSNAESSLFIALVRMSRAGSPAEKGAAERMRLAALKKLVARDIPHSQREIFSRWYYLLIRELFLLKDSKSDPAWIRKKLAGLITEAEASNAIDFLLQTGFLNQTDDGLKVADPVLDTDDEKMQAALLRSFHADVLKMWSKNLAQLSPSDQELGLLNIPISHQRLAEFRERIRQFQDEIIGWVQDDKGADQVVQLGVYLIPFPKD